MKAIAVKLGKNRHKGWRPPASSEARSSPEAEKIRKERKKVGPSALINVANERHNFRATSFGPVNCDPMPKALQSRPSSIRRRGEMLNHDFSAAAAAAG